MTDSSNESANGISISPPFFGVARGLVNAKSDSHTCGIEPSLDYPNVTLLTNALVTKLETDSTGKTISAVRVKRNDAEETYSADVVVVSAGAINSAALLLRSANDKHPNGLANSSDQVGRNYMGHVNSVMLAVSKCPNPTIFQKTLAVNDFYFGSDEFPYPMGHISFVGKLDGVTLSAGAPAIAPGFTLDLMAKHSLDFWLTTEDLPDPNNRVTLNKNGEIVLSYTPNNLEAHKQLQAKLKKLMNNQRKCDIHGGECHHRADRQVDAAGNNDKRYAQRQHAIHRCGEQNANDVAERQEV